MFRPLCRVLALAAAFAAPAAPSAWGEVRIGLANPFSGPYAASGERNRAAVQLAVQTLNQAGGVLGQEVRLVAVDDGCGADRAAAAALELVKAGVAFVVGHMCSHASLTAAPVYEAAGIAMVTPDSTHPRLTEEGRPNVFRLTGRDDEQARMAGDWLAAQRPPRPIGIVHDGSTYGGGLARLTRQRLRQNGGREALFATYAPGAGDHTALVEQVERAGIGLLYVGGYGPDAGRIVRTLRARGSGTQLVGGDALGMEEFWTAAGRAGDGTVFTTLRDAARREPSAAYVLEAFRALGLGSLPSGLGGYAAVQVWAQAAARAGSLDPLEVTEAVHRGRFPTVLGRVAFDPKGDLEGADWQWQVWHDGGYGPLRPAVAMR